MVNSKLSSMYEYKLKTIFSNTTTFTSADGWKYHKPSNKRKKK